MSAPIRVMLVDDHTLFRKGLAELLQQQDGIQVVASTGKSAEAPALLREHSIDVLILDLNLPPHGGLALLRELHEAQWTGPTVMLTVSDSEDDLADAIARAARGETVVAPSMTMKLVDLLQPGKQNKPKESLLRSLTDRERQILEYLSQGLSNKGIARILDISHDTVKLHVRHILAKLNLTSRVEAAVFAVEQRRQDPR